MSIRTLTDRLMEEAVEARRQQVLAPARLPEYDEPAPQKSTFPSGRRKMPPPQPVPETEPEPESAKIDSVRQVGIRPRSEGQTWQVPGGIAARFKVAPGEQIPEALEPEADKTPVADPQETAVAEQTPDEAQSTSEPANENESRQEITIELKSH